MRKFYEDENYRDHMSDIEEDFKHDVYKALLPVIKEYFMRSHRVDPIRLLDRNIEEIIFRLDDQFN